MTTKIKENWKKLNNKQIVKTIEIKEENQTIFVIAPKNYKKFIVPFFCKLCSLPMLTKEDIAAYKKHHMCEKCSYRWAEKDIKSFIYTEEFREYLEVRKELSKPKLNLK